MTIHDPGSEDIFDVGVFGEEESDVELGYDTHVPMVDTTFQGGTGDTHRPQPYPELLEAGDLPRTAPKPKRLVRTRPMPRQLAMKYPDVDSIVLVKRDGRLIVLARS